MSGISYNGGVDGPDGPFEANTRVVAVIALAVAGVFVVLGLALSIARAVQQRTLDRMRVQVAQSQAAQLAAANIVMRSSSSKIPHLVVGPDGMELSIAHKERIKSALQPSTDQSAAKTMGIEQSGPALLSMTGSTAGLLANMHHDLVSQPPHDHGLASSQASYGASNWQISSSHSRPPSSQQTSLHEPADVLRSASEIGAADYQQRHLHNDAQRPLFTADFQQTSA